MTSFTWQAFTWRNYCMIYDFMKSISMKCICMIKVTNTWQNKTMIHINTQPNNIYWRHTNMNEYHPHETKEQLYDVQLYDVQLHDVQLHDVANTWFVSTVGAMRTLLIILCYFHVDHQFVSSSALGLDMEYPNISPLWWTAGQSSHLWFVFSFRTRCVFL